MISAVVTVIFNNINLAPLNKDKLCINMYCIVFSLLKFILLLVYHNILIYYLFESNLMINSLDHQIKFLVFLLQLTLNPIGKITILLFSQNKTCLFDSNELKTPAIKIWPKGSNSAYG